MITKPPIYSKSGNLMILIDLETDNFVAARVFKKIRSYWEPVVAETNMSKERLEKIVNDIY